TLVRGKLRGLLGHVPGIAGEPLVAPALVDVDDEARGPVLTFVPRKDREGRGVRVHDHVGLVDLLEPFDGRAVQFPDATLEFFVAEGRRRNRDVLKGSEDVDELRSEERRVGKGWRWGWLG